LVQAIYNVDVYYAGGNLEIIEAATDSDSASLKSDTPEQKPEK
jgi:hypothetical protein